MDFASFGDTPTTSCWADCPWQISACMKERFLSWSPPGEEWVGILFMLHLPAKYENVYQLTPRQIRLTSKTVPLEVMLVVFPSSSLDTSFVEFRKTRGPNFGSKKIIGKTCKYCGRVFNRRWVCQRHELTHTGQRPYKCKYCTSGFQRREQLLRHEWSHTGQYPHRCSYCGQGFPAKRSKLSHERVCSQVADNWKGDEKSSRTGLILRRSRHSLSWKTAIKWGVSLWSWSTTCLLYFAMAWCLEEWTLRYKFDLLRISFFPPSAPPSLN